MTYIIDILVIFIFISLMYYMWFIVREYNKAKDVADKIEEEIVNTENSMSKTHRYQCFIIRSAYNSDYSPFSDIDGQNRIMTITDKNKSISKNFHYDKYFENASGDLYDEFKKGKHPDLNLALNNNYCFEVEFNGDVEKVDVNIKQLNVIDFFKSNKILLNKIYNKFINRMKLIKSTSKTARRLSEEYEVVNEKDLLTLDILISNDSSAHSYCLNDKKIDNQLRVMVNDIFQAYFKDGCSKGKFAMIHDYPSLSDEMNISLIESFNYFIKKIK